MEQIIKDGKKYEFLFDSDNEFNNGCLGCAFNQTPDFSTCSCGNIGNKDCMDFDGIWKLITEENDTEINN